MHDIYTTISLQQFLTGPMTKYYGITSCNEAEDSVFTIISFSNTWYSLHALRTLNIKMAD